MSLDKKISAVVIASVSVILLLLTSLIFRTEKFIEQNRDTLYIVSELKYHIVNSHVWLEESVNGDIQELEKLDFGFKETDRLIKILINGGEYKNKFYEFTTQDKVVIEALKVIKAEIKFLSDSTFNRLKEESLAGSELDTIHDTHYGILINKIEELQTYLVDNFSNNYNSFSNIQYIIYLLIVVLGLFMMFVVRNYSLNLLKSIKQTERDENRFLTLFNNSLDSIILMEDAKIVDCNETSTQCFGYSKKEILKIDPIELLSEQQNDGRERESIVSEILQEATENGKTEEQLLFHKKNNVHFFGQTTVTRTELEGKEYILVIIRDISKDIEHDRLLVHQSKKAAMGEMLGAISHQLKQPINTLSLVSQELEFIDLNEENAKEEINEAVQHINNGVLLMNETINDFRNFLKPDKNITTFSLDKCVAKVEDFVAKSYSESNISLEIENNLKQEAIIKGIPSELQQVLLSILNNARDVINEKLPKERFVKISITDNQPYYYIAINDSGGGVPHSLMEEIFNPYFTTKGEKGTGIGLFIAQKIVKEKFHGNILIENNEYGAKFSIKIKG